MATLKVYKIGTNRYNSFCVLYNIAKPFLVTEDVLTHLVAFLYKEGLKVGTVKSYLAPTRYTQIALGLGNLHMEDMVRLEYVVQGVKRLASNLTCTRFPITLTLLAQLQCSWLTSRSGRDASMLWAAATMCFFSFLRAGKVVVPSDSAFNPSIHLTVKDISVDSHSSPSYITVKIKASKSNPFRRGVTIYLGQTHNQISPVAATLRYMVERGLSEGPLFVFEDGRLLTRE